MSSTYLKNTFSLALGNAFCQALAFLLMPFVTRLFNPESFGYFSFYISIILFLGPVSNFRFSAAVFAEKDPAVRSQLFFLSYIALFASFVIVFGALEYLYLFHNKLLMSGHNVSLLVAGLVCFAGAKQNAIFYATNLGEFGVITKSRVVETLVDKLIPIALAVWFKPVFLFLLIGRVCSLLLFNASLFLFFMQKKAKIIFKLNYLFSVFNKYKSYAFFSSFSVALNNFSKELPLVLFPLLYTPEIGGFLALGFRIVRLPIQLVAESVSKTFIKQIRISENGEVEYYSNIRCVVALVSVFIVVPLFVIPLFADIFVPFVFGNGWNEAVIYVQIVSLSFFVMVFYIPISTFFDVLRMERVRLVVDLWTAFLSGLVAIASAFFLSPVESIALFVGVQAALQMYGFVRIFRAINLECKKMLLSFLPLYGFSFAVLLALFFVKWFVGNIFMILTLLVVIYVVFFAISIPKFIKPLSR